MTTESKQPAPISRHFDCMSRCRAGGCEKVCIKFDYQRLEAERAELLTALKACAEFWEFGNPVHAGAHVAEEARALLSKLSEGA